MFKLIIIFLPIFIFSCNQRENNEQVQSLQLNPLKTDQVNISGLLEDYYFIQLKTPEGLYFANPDKVTIVNDCIFVLDKMQALKLLVFDMQGKFKFEISGYGRGPGELQQPNDFWVDTTNNLIAIFDPGNLKISHFNLEDGSFIADYPIEFWTSTFAKTKDGYVFYNNNLQNSHNNYNVLFTDRNLEIVSGSVPVTSEQMNFHYSIPRNFTQYEENIYLTIPFDNTVYQVGNNKLETKLIVDFGEYNIPDDFFKTFSEDWDRIREVKKYGYNITNYFESDSLIFFNYNFQGNINYFFKSKGSGLSYHVDKNFLNNYALGPLLGWPVEVLDDYLVWYQQPYRLKTHLEWLQENLNDAEWSRFKKENNNLITFYNSLNPDGNVYLVFTKLDF